jgi:hypothetical protein
MPSSLDLQVSFLQKLYFRYAIFVMQRQDLKNYKLNSHWEIYRTPEHFYAVQTDAANTITANTANIRKAYRIDPATGNYLSHTLNDEGTEEHFTFAVKRFDSPQRHHEATIEAETLQQHQFAEPLIQLEDGCPVVISIYYPGIPLTRLETAETQAHVRQLSFYQQTDLCYQLAKQYYQLHADSRGAKLHIDVKGQNTIIYRGPSDTRWRARLIDFGSVKRVENAQEPIEATINGMTEYAIAPEVISKTNTAYWKMDINSGTVSEKTDIYAFSAILMSLFGATSPYQSRHVSQNAFPGFYDMAALKRSVSMPFQKTGIFTAQGNYRLAYHFSGQSNCRFKRIKGLALEPQVVLTAYQSLQPCYLAYDNYLLYIDGGQVSGYGKPLRHMDKMVAGIDNDQILIADHLALLDTLSGRSRSHTGEQLQNILQTAINEFLDLMGHPDPNERPSSLETYTFFKTVFAMAHLSQCGTDFFDEHPRPQTPQMIERQLRIMQFQLDLMIKGLKVNMRTTQEIIQEHNFSESFEALKQYCNELETSIRNEMEAPLAHRWTTHLCEQSMFSPPTLTDTTTLIGGPHANPN